MLPIRCLLLKARVVSVVWPSTTFDCVGIVAQVIKGQQLNSCMKLGNEVHLYWSIIFSLSQLDRRRRQNRLQNRFRLSAGFDFWSPIVETVDTNRLIRTKKKRSRTLFSSRQIGHCRVRTFAWLLIQCLIAATINQSISSLSVLFPRINPI